MSHKLSRSHNSVSGQWEKEAIGLHVDIRYKSKKRGKYQESIQ